MLILTNMIPHVFLTSLLRNSYLETSESSSSSKEIPLQATPLSQKQLACKRICDIKYAYVQNVGDWIECYKKCKTTPTTETCSNIHK